LGNVVHEGGLALLSNSVANELEDPAGDVNEHTVEDSVLGEGKAVGVNEQEGLEGDVENLQEEKKIKRSK